MPLLHIAPSQVDVKLRGTLGGMPEDLLQDGRGATGLNPERSSGVAEEVGVQLDTRLLANTLENLLNCSGCERETTFTAI